MSYIGNINKEAAENRNFRTVLSTGDKSQLVVMDIKPGEDIGEETHAHVEQTLYIQSGQGQAVLNGEVTDISAGDVVIVSPGTKHNIINKGSDSLKIATIYVPPNHKDGTIHVTKADAIADVADEQFGETI